MLSVVLFNSVQLLFPTSCFTREREVGRAQAELNTCRDGQQSPLTQDAKAGEYNLRVLLSLAQFNYTSHGFALDNITDAAQIEKKKRFSACHCLP